MEIDKEQLNKIKNLLTEHPKEAKELIKTDPQLSGMIQELLKEDEVPVVSFGEGNAQGKSNSGPVKSLSLPGVPKNLFVNDENNRGFSNYLFLAITAFSIQFIITLICIFFYK